MNILSFRKVAGLALAVGVLTGFSTQARAVTFYGLTNTNGLIAFERETPQDITFAIDHIGGLVANDDLIGIDFRPADGLLYSVGTGGGAAGSARVYTIDITTGNATLVSTLDVSLIGSRFGLDFNPVVDRLRIVSNADQNLRVNVVTGATLVDSAVAYQAGDLFLGQNPNIIGSAYSNDFPGATSTQLFAIDSVHNILVAQVVPNAGALQTIGQLGIDVSQLAGFDIYVNPDTLANTAIAAFQNIAEGVSRLYSIDLITGQASPIGQDMGDLIDGLAIPIVIPEPSTVALLALGLVGLTAKLVRRRVGR